MILTTDGCSSGLCYALSYKDVQGVEHPVVFAGRGLRPNEKKFGISEIECLTVLFEMEYSISLLIWRIKSFFLELTIVLCSFLRI